MERPSKLFKAGRCDECRRTGYHGRIGVFEVAVPNREIREAIERGSPEDELRDLLRTAGTNSLRADALVKVRDGVTTLDEIDSMTWVQPPHPG